MKNNYELLQQYLILFVAYKCDLCIAHPTHATVESKEKLR